MQNLKRNLKINNTTYTIAIAIVMSILFLLFPIFTSPDFNWNFRFIKVVPFQRSFVTYLLALSFFFINWKILLPQFFFKRKYVIYIIVLLVLFTLSNYIPLLFFKEQMPERMPAPPMGMNNRPMPFIPAQNTFQFLFAFAVSLLIATHHRVRQMEQQKLEVELSYLKAQINPHFFFNSLNSIYALVLQKSDKAPNALIQLSNMMRYVLEDGVGQYIELSKEINFLKDYFALQSFRLHDDVKVAFKMDDSQLSNGLIAPMLFATFIENAFKYGVNPDEPGNIKVSITMEADNRLRFYCSNSIVRFGNSLHVQSAGIGLKNAQQRLDNLYGGQYILDVKQDNNTYQVNLILPLK